MNLNLFPTSSRPSKGSQFPECLASTVEADRLNSSCHEDLTMLQGQYHGHWLSLQGIIEIENLSN